MGPGTPSGIQAREITSPVIIVKIGGNVIDDEPQLAAFLKLFASIPNPKILIHGGGKLATDTAHKLGLPQTMIEGRRVTDASTLKIISMVYGGWINKSLVATLQSLGCRAFGVTGADGDLIRSRKRAAQPVDYGFVGDIVHVRSDLLRQWLHHGVTPVIAPITHDGQGQLLNTNADTIANEVATTLAKELGAQIEVILVYSFEKPGVLVDVKDESSLISKITPDDFQRLKEEGKVFSGMIPKLDNACKAIRGGVKRVVLGRSQDLLGLISGKAGTSVSHD